MINVVKLILVCQAKDDIMPQLMPLIWCYSVLIRLVVVFILMEIFYYKFTYNINKLYYEKIINIVSYKW